MHGLSQRPAALRIRAYRPGDEASILALHNRAYADHPDRSAAHWKWKHESNPLRRTDVIVAMDSQNQCCMVHAGVTLPAVLEGEPCFAGLHMDVAVAPHLRRGLGAARPLVSTMRRFVQEYGGGDTRLIWGYPEPALQRLGLRFGMFQVLRDVTLLVRDMTTALEASQTDAPANIAGLVTRTVLRFDADVDELWERCRLEVGTGVVRNASYLNWRFADHPDVAYTLLEVRSSRTNRLEGVAVYREGGWEADSLSLVEWLAPRAQLDAERALLQRVKADAVQLRRRWLVSWIAGAADLFHRFQTTHGFFVLHTPYQVTYKSWAPIARRRWLQDNWYQTMGDIDFF